MPVLARAREEHPGGQGVAGGGRDSADMTEGACFGAQVKDTDVGKAWLEAAETAHMRAMDAASAAGSFASQLAAQGQAAREANPVNEEDAGGFPVYVQTPGIQCLFCRCRVLPPIAHPPGPGMDRCRSHVCLRRTGRVFEVSRGTSAC